MFVWTRRVTAILAILVIALVGLAPSVSAQQQGQPEQVRTFIGDISGLENIGAKFVVIVAPDRRAAAFVGSRDDNFNQQYAKWYIGAVNGTSFVGTATDGTLFSGT